MSVLPLAAGPDQRVVSRTPNYWRLDKDPGITQVTALAHYYPVK